MSDCHQKRPAPARVRIVLPLRRLLAHKRHKKILTEKHNRPVEPRRSHTDDGKRMFVHEDGAAHHAAIVPKTAVPIVVRENDVRSAARAMLIGRVKEPAKIRLDTEYVEVVPGHFIDEGA